MSKCIPLVEVKQHNSEQAGVWLVIHDEVYDVSKYLAEHPGGADALLDYAGKDGTQAFEDVGHSEDARTVMKKFRIGHIPLDETSVSRIDIKIGKATTDLLRSCFGHVQRTKSQNSLNIKASGRVTHIIVPLDRKSQSDLDTRSFPKARPRTDSELRRSGVGAQKPDCFIGPMESEKMYRSPDRRPSTIRFRDEESSRNWWKWAAIAAATALVVGFLVKKYKS